MTPTQVRRTIKVCTVCDTALGAPHDAGDHSRAGWRRVEVVLRSEADRVAAALSDVCDNTLTVHDARLVAADYWGGK